MTALMQQSLDYSIEKWGYVDLIVVDEQNQIINGEHRYKSLLNQGYKEIEVIKYPFKNEQEKELFRQSANKLHGEHDKELDAQIMYDLIKDDESNMLELMRLTAEENEQNIHNLINQYHVDEEGLKLEEQDEDQETQQVNYEVTKIQCPKCGNLFDK